MFTRPLCELTAKDLELLVPDMLDSRVSGSNHYANRPQYADWALQECTSVWLKPQDFTGTYPVTLGFIRSYALSYHENPRYGRCYYTTVPPGGIIKDHADVEHYFENVTRYHVYFDLHPRHLLRQKYSVIKSNHLHLFRYDRSHAYINASDVPWTFLVFDVLH